MSADEIQGPTIPQGKPTLFLVDGPSQMFRAFYAIRGLSNKKGLPTGAIYGFTNMLRKVLRDFEPDYLGIAFDTAAPTFRHEAYEEYKANREEMPEDLSVQVPHVKEVCDVLGAPLLERDGWEADDLIATLARKAAAQGIHSVIVTQDKDLFQLVDDDTWILYNTKGRDVMLDAAGVTEKFGVPPGKVADVLALMGDSVDNIPGVPGIGEKGAKKILDAIDSLDEILADPDKVAEIEGLRGAAGYARKLVEHEGEARRSRMLVALDEDAPVELDLDALRVEDPDPEQAYAFFKRMQFNRLLEEFSEPLEEAGDGYRCVLDRKELERAVARAREQGRVAVDTETDSLDPVRARIVGFSLGFDEGDALYVPLAHDYVGCPDQIDRGRALALLRDLMEDPAVAKVGQNLKYDITVLAGEGIAVEGELLDTMIAAYLIHPTRGSFGLDSLASEYLKYRCISYEEVCGKGKSEIPFTEVDLDTATRYAAEDADIALRLWKQFEAEIVSRELGALFREIEMPLVPILAAMERAGIRVDVEMLEEMSERLGAKLEELTAAIYEEAGEEFNINSPQQLGAILFEKMELPVLRKTQKTGRPSTSEQVLQRLASNYELPRRILEYRELQKLKSTYVDALPALVDPETGRIHPSYHQAVAATGRLSASEPNIQNIPIRTELGRSIRKAFVPEDGWIFLAADYSQVELRVLAHLAGDPKLIETFRAEEDVHRRTAAEVFDVPPAEVTSQQRSRAKAVNFGILYGMGPTGLSQQIDVSYQEAKDFIARYFERYPAVQDYIDRTLEQLRETGQVTTLFHRVRAFPEVTSSSGRQRSFAERAAINTTIQGTAADLMKMAMIRVHGAIEEAGSLARMIMQIHDELVFEVPEAEESELRELVRREMEHVHEMRVPLVVDITTGHSWYDL